MARVIHEEHVFSRGIALALGTLAAVMLGLTVQQWLASPPAGQPEWVFPGLFLLFVLLAVNFARLDIIITDELATVGFGIVRSRTRWQDIRDCYRDEASVLVYGGWGIRIGRYRGLWRLAFTTIGAPRIVLLRRDRVFPELVFSTGDPEAAAARIRAVLGRCDV